MFFQFSDPGEAPLSNAHLEFLSEEGLLAFQDFIQTARMDAPPENPV